METLVQGYQAPEVNADLFADIALGAQPTAITRRVITEDSYELVRIQDTARSLDLGYMDGAMADMSAEAYRGVLIKVIALAFQDLSLAMKRPDPRQLVRKGAGGQVSSENYHFRSAVLFFFLQDKVYDESNEFVGCYSTFNSYCALLELDAPRVRRILLNAFPTLAEIVRGYIPNAEFRAPVASGGPRGGDTLSVGELELGL